jgi:high-affinity Fe2+/Pb2+ permease
MTTRSLGDSKGVEVKQRTRVLISVICGLIAAITLGVFLYQTATASERAKAQLLNRFGGTTTQILVADKTIQKG